MNEGTQTVYDARQHIMRTPPSRTPDGQMCVHSDTPHQRPKACENDGKPGHREAQKTQLRAQGRRARPGGPRVSVVINIVEY